MLPGTASRVANDELLNVRSYLNEGGRLLFTGKYAGFQYAFGYEFDPINGAACDPESDADGCFPLGDDFLQYYLGAYLYNDDAGTTPEGTIYDDPRRGHAVPGPELDDRGSEREQPGSQRVVHRDERHPAGRDLPAVHELGVGQVQPPGRPVRAAYGRLLRVLRDRRRLVQAPDPHRRSDGEHDRQPVVLDLAQHRGGLGSRLRRGSHGGPGQLDHPARRERAHDHGDRGELRGRLA